MTVQIHGKTYKEVKERLRSLYGKPDRQFPSSYIVTELVWNEPNFDSCLFKATVYPNESDSDKRLFTGFAFEKRLEASTEVNFSSWVENCETSAIGRALANMDIGVSDDAETITRPSGEEMKKVDRWKNAAPVAKPLTKISVRSPLGEWRNKLDITRGIVKDLLGHDQIFEQMLSNNGLRSLDEATSESLKVMYEGLYPFIDLIKSRLGDVGVKTLREVKDETKKAELANEFKKMALLL